MSNKKRKNRKLVSDSSEVSSEAINQPSEDNGIKNSDLQSVQADSSSKPGVISYLKSNLWLVGIICFLALGTLGAGLKYLDDDARREIARRINSKGNLNDRSDQSFLNKVNPFLPTPTPVPTPQVSKAYIYAGSRLLAVEDANANAASPADLAIWRPSTGYWWVMKPDGNVQALVGWGTNGDKTVQGDYDGDGKTDFSVFRPATANTSATWWILRSSTQDTSYYSIPFGAVDDIPAQADFDGDGKTDIAIYRAGAWYIQQSSNSATINPSFGSPGDIPTPKDFDGDGKADLAVFRPSNGTWYIQGSAIGFGAIQFGQTGDAPVPADYDGDGKADFALRRSNNWIFLNISNGQTQTIPWQLAGDMEVRNDYDGDGKVDIAVWRSSNGTWYIRQSSRVGQTDELRQVQWGMTGDTPVPALYRR